MSLQMALPVVETFLGQSALFERIVSLHMTTIHPASPLEVHCHFQMCSTRAKSLTRLHLNGFPNNPNAIGLEDIIIDMQIMEPILSCPHLTKLMIKYLTLLCLSESDLRLIGVKLPKLRKLLLGQSPFRLSPPHLSISVLLPILENNYPNLEIIGLFLEGNDPMNVTKFHEPHPTLRQLRLGLSPLSKENTHEAALILSTLFTIQSKSDSPSHWAYASSEFADAYRLQQLEDYWGVWFDVQCKLSLLVAARDDERRMYEDMQEFAVYKKKGISF
ncbi:hypothetical protein M422DRAFT_45503 [Sphaerobolus stellatus SS14]|uniref:Uncharacterized protein n=1 Tax=Sphaerobolus stellatus (strain SS14) TaxID=990650 RepID=A0A0C9W621_SPHS4|nr:hypothetical protein M422DRAFT_45503 [Sphaerobolus stellatus SS14]